MPTFAFDDVDVDVDADVCDEPEAALTAAELDALQPTTMQSVVLPRDARPK